MDSVAYNSVANRIIGERIAILQSMTFADAAALPETRGEDVVIAEQNASVTIFRQNSPYQLEGQVLVTVLVARQRWFGMTSYHIERGLVFSKDGSVREATETELQNSGG